MVAGFATAPLAAQQGSVEARLRQMREDAARNMRERDSLEARLRQLEGSVRNLAAEARLAEQRADAQARAVSAIDRQLRTIESEMDTASASLVRKQDELLVKQAVLRRRLVDIYKRGALYSVEAMLSARSFGELVARYKYLRVVALRDRALVQRELQLRDEVGGQRELLVTLQNELASSRTQRAQEERRLRSLEQEWGRRLTQTQRERERATQRMRQIEAEQRRFDDLIASLEADRRRAAADPASAAPRTSNISTRSIGGLAWPVEGDVIYSFGRLRNPNNAVTRWNGIGIAATVGTPVRAVAGGVVELVGALPRLPTYGNCVILAHGSDRSVYCSLGRISVGRGQIVQQGDEIGQVGIADADLGPHLHFEIRPAGRSAVDPLEWLRARR